MADSADDGLLEELNNSIKSIMEKAVSSKFANDLRQRIYDLQERLENVSGAAEKLQLLNEMKDSFRGTIKTVENKLSQLAQFERAYIYSILAALVFLILFVFALFGYKFCMTLIAKLFEKQGKSKTRQSKKSNKFN